MDSSVQIKWMSVVYLSAVWFISFYFQEETIRLKQINPNQTSIIMATDLGLLIAYVSLLETRHILVN